MTWKRALLVYPYGPEKRSERLYGGLAVLNPIGMEIVAGRLKGAVEDLLLADLRLETEPIEALIRRFRPDLIGVSLMWGRDERTNTLLRTLPRDATIIVGGLYATRHAEEILADFPEVDILAVGYGEDALRELVERGSPEGVAGLWYRRRPTAWPPDARGPTGPPFSRKPQASAPSADGPVIRNPRRQGPDVRHFRIDRSVRRHEYPWMTLKGDNVLTSIGCPMVCAFCKWRENIFGEAQPWLGRNPEDVVAELAECDADVVHIVDANFSADLGRIERICDLLIERRVRHLYACEIRVNALARSPALLSKMERAGFFMFMVGIESCQPRLLKAMRKGYTVETCRRAFRNLAGTHILALGNFLIGNPGETEAEMVGIADYAAGLGCDFISPNKIYAYENTDFERWVLAQPGMRVEGRRRYITSDAFGVEDLRHIQARIMLRFLRLHPPWIAYRKALGHPMVAQLGRERLRRAMLRSLWNHVADPHFRRRALKRLLKRFRPAPAPIADSRAPSSGAANR